MHDDPPDELRPLLDALRHNPTPRRNDDALLRQQVREMVGHLTTVVPDPPASSPDAPSPPAWWRRHGAALGFALGVGVGVGAHALLAQPRERVVVRTVPVETPPPTAPAATARAAEPAVTAAPPPSLVRERPDAGAQEPPRDESRLREQLLRVEQLLDEGRAPEALRRLRPLDRGALTSPMLAGLREELAVRALAANGDAEGARRRGERYLSRNPASAHARAIRATLERMPP